MSIVYKFYLKSLKGNPITSEKREEIVNVPVAEEALQRTCYAQKELLLNRSCGEDGPWRAWEWASVDGGSYTSVSTPSTCPVCGAQGPF